MNIKKISKCLLSCIVFNLFFNAEIIAVTKTVIPTVTDDSASTVIEFAKAVEEDSSNGSSSNENKILYIALAFAALPSIINIIATVLVKRGIIPAKAGDSILKEPTSAGKIGLLADAAAEGKNDSLASALRVVAKGIRKGESVSKSFRAVDKALKASGIKLKPSEINDVIDLFIESEDPELLEEQLKLKKIELSKAAIKNLSKKLKKLEDAAKAEEEKAEAQSAQEAKIAELEKSLEGLKTQLQESNINVPAKENISIQKPTSQAQQSEQEAADLLAQQEAEQAAQQLEQADLDRGGAL